MSSKVPRFAGRAALFMAIVRESSERLVVRDLVPVKALHYEHGEYGCEGADHKQAAALELIDGVLHMLLPHPVDQRSDPPLQRIDRRGQITRTETGVAHPRVQGHPRYAPTLRPTRRCPRWARLTHRILQLNLDDRRCRAAVASAQGALPPAPLPRRATDAWQTRIPAVDCVPPSITLNPEPLQLIASRCDRACTR